MAPSLHGLMAQVHKSTKNGSGRCNCTHFCADVKQNPVSIIPGPSTAPACGRRSMVDQAELDVNYGFYLHWNLRSKIRNLRSS